MRRKIHVICFIAFALATWAAASPPDTAPEPEGPYIEIVVKVSPEADPAAVARQLMGRDLGPVGIVPGYRKFSIPRYQSLSWEASAEAAQSVSGVEWSGSLRPRKRVPQQAVAPVPDPLYAEQWHLSNTGQGFGTRNEDARVAEAWSLGVSGSGVIVGIVDDSVQITHPDLAPNYLSGFGLDARDGDSNPAPVTVEDRHGTAVAGIAVAASNSLGGAGIAYGASLAAIRLIGDFFDDTQEVNALTFRYTEIDVYNNSWGPSDEEGVRYAGPSTFIRDNMRTVATTGRGGLGSIYVWAAGNGKQSGANSNYDGYNALPYTISVGAVGQDGKLASYSEPGANVLVVAPSQGRGDGITTTDNTGSSGYAPGDYFSGFNGTSAAAPMVAGVVALILEANPALTWRDVQHILVRTAVRNDPEHEDWSRNGAGLNINHQYGFGRVDAAAAVRLARAWPGTKIQTTVSSGTISRSTALGSTPTVVSWNFTQAVRAEHVTVRVAANHSAWGDLEVVLVSPSGTRSVLAEPHGSVSGSIGNWTYLSVHHWDEDIRGTWRVEVADKGGAGSGSLISVRIEITGTSIQAGDNRAPQALDEEIITRQFPFVYDLGTVASDPDGDALEVIGLSGPAHGEVRQVPGGIEYRMDSDYRGVDRFGYTLHDGRGGTVNRYVDVINPLPRAGDDFALTSEGEPVTIPVLANDADGEGEALFVAGFGQGRRGTVALADAGSLRYSPTPGFTGWDRFFYTVSDGDDGVDTGWVTVVIDNPENFTLRFDGVDDVVITDPLASFNPRDKFTVEAMIHPTGWGEYVTGFGRIFDKGTLIFFLNGFDHSFYNDQSLVCYFVLENGQVTAANSVAGSVALDRWQHVAVSFDSAAAVPVRIYVDGQAVNLSYPIEGSLPPSVRLDSNAADQAFIGEAPSGERAFRGSISDLRVWSRVLNQTEIAARMNSELTGFESGLSALFRFDEGSGLRTGGRGALAPMATIEGAEWVARVPPWTALYDYFPGIVDLGTGWWTGGGIGPVAADTFAWLWAPSAHWLYAAGEGGDDWIFFAPEPAPRWLRSNPVIYPWAYDYSIASWVRLRP